MQQDEIDKEIRESQVLTSDLLDLKETLSAVYKDADTSTHFIAGIGVLSQTYDKIRTIRGDGNCYYRAFLYNLCEQLVDLPKKDDGERSRIEKLVKESNSFVTSVGGYDEVSMEIFYDSMVEFLETGLTTLSHMHEELLQETSDYCTWYMRVLTASYLKSDPPRFLPYLEDGFVDIHAYCRIHIEPMGKECGMVQVLALAEYFKVRVIIEYLDGHDLSSGGDGKEGQLTQHSFGPDDSLLQVRLLYRPGHYDIIYRKESTSSSA